MSGSDGADPIGASRPDWRDRVSELSWRGTWLLVPVSFAVGSFVTYVVRTEAVREYLAFFAASLLGTLVGVTELIARYKDSPTAALNSLPGYFYIAVNTLVSFIVFWLLQTERLKLGLSPDDTLAPTLTRVLLAGVGAMALLRTAVFTLRVKDSDIAIGPAALLQVILAAADRECDRQRAGPRAKRVKAIMRGVSFARARTALLAHCMALMQNLSADEQSALQQATEALASRAMSEEVKAYNLGLFLMNYVGEDVLAQAVEALGSLIQGPPPDDPPIFAQAAGLSFADDMPTIVELCKALDPLQRDFNRDSLQAIVIVVPRDPDRNVLALAMLQRIFGADTVTRAIALLLAGRPPKDSKIFTGALSDADAAPGP